jgi:hypothetical protein
MAISKAQKKRDVKPFFDIQRITIIFIKAMDINSKPTPETFPELPQVIFWMRFMISILYGTIIGIRNLRGTLMLLNAINIIMFIPFAYCRLYLGINVDSYNHTSSSLSMAGLLPAIALFLLIWIYFFTKHHEVEIEIISKYILNTTMTSNDADPINGDGPIVDEVTPLTNMVDDTEF